MMRGVINRPLRARVRTFQRTFAAGQCCSLPVLFKYGSYKSSDYTGTSAVAALPCRCNQWYELCLLVSDL